MPRQWKLIALYMVIVYLVFVVCIQIAKREAAKDALAASAAYAMQHPPANSSVKRE